MLWWLLLFIILIALIASLPTYPYSRDWGYVPSGIISVILVIILIMLLMGFVR